MRSDRTNPTRPLRAIPTWLAVAALMLIFAGCNNTYGRFTRDAQVDQAFRTGAHQPEYNYYYSGRDDMPYAIIGIEQNYTVPSRYWIPFEPEPALLKKMSGNVYGKDLYQPYGSVIRDPEGKAIGVWYSSVFERSVTVDQENRTVQILFRNPENTNGGRETSMFQP